MLSDVFWYKYFLPFFALFSFLYVLSLAQRVYLDEVQLIYSFFFGNAFGSIVKLLPNPTSQDSHLCFLRIL